LYFIFAVFLPVIFQLFITHKHKYKHKQPKNIKHADEGVFMIYLNAIHHQSQVQCLVPFCSLALLSTSFTILSFSF